MSFVGPLKLNLAAGTDLKPPPWRNLDVVPLWPTMKRGCDVIWDARHDVIPFPDASAQEVVAGYLLLHLAPKYHESVLKEIRRVLCPGGKLQVGEVDMDVVMRRWLDNPEDVGLSELIWGEQGHRTAAGFEVFEQWDKHCWGFTEPKLRATLERAGFKNIQRVKIHAAEVFYELTLECER